MGKAVDFLAYFILAFRKVAREGIGLNRARCELDRVEALPPHPRFPPTVRGDPGRLLCKGFTGPQRVQESPDRSGEVPVSAYL
jgi:hypothetical protein